MCQFEILGNQFLGLDPFLSSNVHCEFANWDSTEMSSIGVGEHGPVRVSHVGPV